MFDSAVLRLHKGYLVSFPPAVFKKSLMLLEALANFFTINSF